MDQFVISIGAKISEYAVAPVGRWLIDSFRYSSNIQNMKSEEEKLQDAKTTVLRRVEAARRNGEEIEGAVQRWLTEVGAETENVREVLEVEVKTGCSLGACLDVKRRHQQSRRARKIVQAICNLRTEMGRFDKVSYRPPPQELITLTDPNYVMLASRRRSTEGLLNALRDTNINVIGFWGMGGIGKTTLVKQASRQAREEKLFDEVAIATVTPSPDPKEIQKEIAEMLGLKFDEESVTPIGIPSEGCKLILTSRNRDVLISDMGTQKDFGLGVLSKEEAWSLFEKMGGNSVKDPNILPTATEVAEKCGGLPIALVTVSRALKNKDLHQWKDALRQLKRPVPGQVTDILREVYIPIELSYEHLECEEVKSVFLLCALLRFAFPFADLLNYSYGLGLFDGIITLEDATNRLRTVIRALEDSCLLLRFGPSYFDQFRMHDIVRGVGRHIASKNHNMLVMSDDDGWPDVDVLQRCKAFSILEECVLGDISIIGELKNLQVLRFIASNITQLPREIGLLTRLRMLDLTDCSKLEVIPPNVLSSLAELEELYMGNSFVDWEAEGVHANERKNASLAELKHLSHLITLEIHIRDSNVQPKDLMFEKLERHKIFVGDVWEWDEEHETSRTLKLKLNSHFQSNDGIKMLLKRTKSLFLDELKGIKSVLYDKGPFATRRIGDKRMQHNGLNSGERRCEIEDGYRVLFPQLRKLVLDSLPKLFSFLSRRSLLIISADEITPENNIEFRMPILHEQVVFPKLEELELCLIDLEEMARSSSRLANIQPTPRFQNLSSLIVNGSGKIEYLLSYSTARSMVQLKHLEVSKCKDMDEILTANLEEVPSPKELFPLLEFLWLKHLPVLKRFCIGCNIQFPSLQRLHIDHCPKLMTFICNPVVMEINANETPSNVTQPLFSEEVAFPSLNKLTITHIDNMRTIWHNQVIADSFCKLQEMRVEACANLSSIFPTKILKILKCLQTLTINDCGSLREVFDIEGPGFQETSANVTVTQLKLLYLTDLPKLKNIWNKDPQGTFSFQNLREVTAMGCESMKSLFPASVAKNLQLFKHLTIYNCGVEAIIEKEGRAEAATRRVFPKLTSMILERLPKLKRFSPGIDTLEWPSLEKLIVKECDQIEIFTLEKSTHEIDQQRQLETAIQQPLFMVEEDAFPNLKDLELDLNHIIWPSQFWEELFCKLRVLKVVCNEDTSAFSPNFFGRLHNLEKLVVVESCWEEIFRYEVLVGQENQARNLTHLRDLELFKLPMLTHLWKEDTHPCPIFHDLEILVVEECAKLKNLVPSSVSFQNLTSLKIFNCSGLINLVTSSTAKSLEQLKKMSVSDCKRITEIIARDIEITQKHTNSHTRIDKLTTQVEHKGIQKSPPNVIQHGIQSKKLATYQNPPKDKSC
ncbi:hypothetical protein CJ030_MR8G027520 [Morella rubra]|uniref:NB-ARC domain-containing protein n=1 Tax=Morella rubra TaxID=262757 RepID=A0A6A1US90_9ROSI|nr:hypothetical protein CJ030_MR8G027520 [Morella rubra]